MYWPRPPCILQMVIMWEQKRNIARVCVLHRQRSTESLRCNFYVRARRIQYRFGSTSFLTVHILNIISLLSWPSLLWQRWSMILWGESFLPSAAITLYFVSFFIINNPHICITTWLCGREHLLIVAVYGGVVGSKSDVALWQPPDLTSASIRRQQRYTLSDWDLTHRLAIMMRR